jgi:single-strand DNA-binding protein
MDFNKCILIGRFTRDPEIRFTPGGKAVCNFSLAVNKSKDQVSYINCVAWEKTAELIKQYCVKGSQSAVEGRLEQSSYEKDGEKKYKVEVVISSIQFIGKKEKTEEK